MVEIKYRISKKITILGSISKVGNNGESSFFLNDWSPKDVVDAIIEAYTNRVYQIGNTYNGTGKGINIQMYLDGNQQIISAFPDSIRQP